MKILTDRPLVSKEVYDYLLKQFPDTLPKNTQCHIETIRYLQGQQSVVEYIKQLTEFQEDDE
jgi:hypothetical protein